MVREAYELGVMDVINKPVIPYVVSRRVGSVIELFRAAYLGVAEYSLQYNLISAGTTLIVLALGVVLFSHTEKTFMDTV